MRLSARQVGAEKSVLPRRHLDQCRLVWRATTGRVMSGYDHERMSIHLCIPKHILDHESRHASEDLQAHVNECMGKKCHGYS